MREASSPAVSRAIEAAFARANVALSAKISARFLLAALIEEEDGRATQLLEKHGAPRQNVRQHLDAPIADSPVALDQILANARANARERDVEDTVTSEFFLLAVLQSDRVLLNRLETNGLDFAGLERSILGDLPPPVQVDETLGFAAEPERAGVARIMDVNANRAREALRVLDDYCRFECNDFFLTSEIKRLRHDLAELLVLLPGRLLLGARETMEDVGTTISTPGEMARDSLRDVAQVNLKRLQESLRSLEEYSKIISSAFAMGIEQLRYRTYTLEKAVVVAGDSRLMLRDARLYVLLTGSQCIASLDWTIAEAAAGGAGVFQLREKNIEDRALLERAKNVRQWTRQARALFIVNDRPDIARLAEADGVHLGQDDMPVGEARRILGPDAIIGVSTHDLEQVRQAVLDGANYIGVGPAFPSSTKEFSELAGLSFVRSATAETTLPIFVIGGVGLETIDAAAAVGARAVAVSAAIAKANEPRLVARTLCEALPRRGRP